MQLFFDTEFTGLQKDTSLISLGIIAENGECFYAKLTDYNEEQVNDWIEENVINNLELSDEILANYNITEVEGNKEEVKNALLEWLNNLGADKFELVSDVCHYDMFLFCDLFGGAFNIPSCVNPVCYDICQDIARYSRVSRETFEEGSIVDGKPAFKSVVVSMDLPYPIEDTIRLGPSTSVKSHRLVSANYNDYVSLRMEVAFNFSRELLCKGLTGKLPKGYKHNSLYDAEVIKMIMEAIN
jgi:hypothetical protein